MGKKQEERAAKRATAGGKNKDGSRLPMPAMPSIFSKWQWPPNWEGRLCPSSMQKENVLAKCLSLLHMQRLQVKQPSTEHHPCPVCLSTGSVQPSLLLRLLPSKAQETIHHHPPHSYPSQPTLFTLSLVPCLSCLKVRNNVVRGRGGETGRDGERGSENTQCRHKEGVVGVGVGRCLSCPPSVWEEKVQGKGLGR